MTLCHWRVDQLIGRPQTVPLPPLPEAYWTGEHHATVPREMTAELAELVGYFMGDGSLHSRGLRFCVTESDIDVVERLRLLAKAVFGLEVAVSAKKGYTEVRLDSVRVVLWWEACGFAKQSPAPGHSGKGYIAHIPSAVLAANDRKVYSAFLRGLYEADGDTSSGYTTVQEHVVRARSRRPISPTGTPLPDEAARGGADQRLGHAPDSRGAAAQPLLERELGT